MNISRSLIRLLENMFVVRGQLSTMDIKNLYIASYLNSHYDLIVPVILYKAATNNDIDTKKVAAGFTLGTNNDVRATSSSIITNFLSNNTTMLRRIKNKSGIEYYGSKYCIFKKWNNNLFPLIIPARIISRVNTGFYKNCLLVDNRVPDFDDMVSKFIMKKVIPAVLSMDYEVLIKDLKNNIYQSNNIPIDNENILWEYLEKAVNYKEQNIPF